jgi:S1-C subfamily serine protease
MASSGSAGLGIVAWVVKVVAMVVGFAGSVVGLASLIGIFTANGWARALGALVVAVGVPLFVADRLLPDDPGKAASGVVTDTLSLSWFGFVFVFAGALHALSKPLLVREGDRLHAAGWALTAQAAWFMASARPTGEGAPPLAPDAAASTAASSAPAPSTSAAAGTPASAAPSSSASAQAAPGAAPDAGPAKPRGDERTPAELFQELAPSVVTIFRKGSGDGSGTGFLVDADGVLATNHHVIEGASQLRIKFMNGTVYEAIELLSDAPALDLALLRVDLAQPMEGGAPPPSKPLALGDSDKVVVGERAISIGNPLGLEHTLTDGLVSARRLYEGRAWIQMSVPVSPGNSGGPLFDMRGAVIGITTQQVLGGAFGRAQNLNLAVPVNELKKLIQPSYPQRRKFGEGNGASQW